MEAKVIRAYRTKGKDDVHKVGETVTLDKARFDELKAKGFVVESVKDQKEEVVTLKKENDSLKKENAELKAKVTELTTVIENAAKDSV